MFIFVSFIKSRFFVVQWWVKLHHYSIKLQLGLITVPLNLVAEQLFLMMSLCCAILFGGGGGILQIWCSSWLCLRERRAARRKAVPRLQGPLHMPAGFLLSVNYQCPTAQQLSGGSKCTMRLTSKTMGEVKKVHSHIALCLVVQVIFKGFFFSLGDGGC